MADMNGSTPSCTYEELFTREGTMIRFGEGTSYVEEEDGGGRLYKVDG